MLWLLLRNMCHDSRCSLNHIPHTVLPFRGNLAVAGVALNCNTSLLAVWIGLTVHVYSVQAVVNDGITEPLTSWYTDDSARVRQVG